MIKEEYKRDLIFEVMLNEKVEFDINGVKANVVLSGRGKGGRADSKVVSLDSCFKGFEQEELLDGDDQWYCNKCKEHRDIHKKLELFKIPKILIIHLKRFQSKKGAGQSSGRSNFFNMAYA